MAGAALSHGYRFRGRCSTFARSGTDFVAGVALSRFGTDFCTVCTDFVERSAQSALQAQHFQKVRFRGKRSTFARSGTQLVAGTAESQGRVQISPQAQQVQISWQAPAVIVSVKTLSLRRLASVCWSRQTLCGDCECQSCSRYGAEFCIASVACEMVLKVVSLFTRLLSQSRGCARKSQPLSAKRAPAASASFVCRVDSRSSNWKKSKSMRRSCTRRALENQNFQRKSSCRSSSLQIAILKHSTRSMRHALSQVPPALLVNPRSDMDKRGWQEKRT